MKVTVDLSMAETVYEFITVGQLDNTQLFTDLIETLSNMESFQKMLKFYDGIFDKDQYAEILYLALNGLDYETQDESLHTLYVNLKRISNIDLVRCKLDLIRAYDYETISTKLAQTLPEEVDLDVNIIFLFDGINGGSILGENDMLLNVMFWPSDISKLNLIEGILLHEYHHIGIKNILRNESYLTSKNKDSSEIAKNLLARIMSEGAATYLFNEGQDLYPLVLESHGQEYATMYLESMNLRSIQLPDLIKAYEIDLHSTLSNVARKESNDALISKYCYNTEGLEPRDKAIGYHMCKVINDEFGRRALIQCLKNPIEFLRAYSTVNNIEAELRYSNEFVSQYSDIFSA